MRYASQYIFYLKTQVVNCIFCIWVKNTLFCKFHGSSYKHAVAVFLLLLSFATSSFVNDKTPINIQAHTVIIDKNKKIVVWIGNVKMTQGSLMINAEKIQIFSEKETVTKVVAKGKTNKPVYYRQNQYKQDDFIEATAQNIIYFVDKKFVRFIGKVHLTQGADSFSGDTLSYDIKKNHIIAKKSKDDTQRIRFKIKL